MTVKEAELLKDIQATRNQIDIQKGILRAQKYRLKKLRKAQKYRLKKLRKAQK